VFGNSLANTHQFTGSILATGSLNINSGSFYIGSNNQIGVNNNSPSSQFVVGKIGNNATLELNLNNTGYSRIFSYDRGATASTNLILQDPGGYVGIGTTAPSSSLHIYGSTYFGSRLILERTAGAIGRYSLGVDTANNQFGITDEAQGNLTRFSINSSGNVGIGVSPSAWGSGTTALQIGTAATLWNRSSDNLLVLASNSYFDGSADKQITTNTSNRMYFVNGGTYFERAASTAAGSSTPWSSSMVISANGSIGAPTAGTNIYNASDVRLKQNVTTITNGLSKINALNPVKFNWIHNFEPTENDKDLLGFIAQEVQTVLPEVVENFGNNSITVGETVIDNPLRVNEKFIIPVLVKAIQELKAENDTLKAILQRNNIQ
jgi:hypothetical protein